MPRSHRLINSVAYNGQIKEVVRSVVVAALQSLSQYRSMGAAKLVDLTRFASSEARSRPPGAPSLLHVWLSCALELTPAHLSWREAQARGVDCVVRECNAAAGEAAKAIADARHVAADIRRQ